MVSNVRWFLDVVRLLQSISWRENSVGRATGHDGPWRASLAARTASTRRSNVWKTFASACSRNGFCTHQVSRNFTIARIQLVFPNIPNQNIIYWYILWLDSTRSLPLLLQINSMSSLCRSYHSGRQYYVRVDITFNITSCHVFPQIQQCCEIAYTCWIKHSGFCGSSFRSWFLSGRSKSPKWPSLQVPSCLTGLRFHKPHSDLTTSPMTSLTWNILEHLGTQLTGKSHGNSIEVWKSHGNHQFSHLSMGFPSCPACAGCLSLDAASPSPSPRPSPYWAENGCALRHVGNTTNISKYILSRNMGSSGSSGSDGHCDVVNMFISLCSVFLWGILEIFCRNQCEKYAYSGPVRLVRSWNKAWRCWAKFQNQATLYDIIVWLMYEIIWTIMYPIFLWKISVCIWG